MNPEILQLGALSIIFALAIKEYFAYQKSKNNGKNGKDYDNEQNERLARVEVSLKHMEKLTENHISHIQDDIKRIYVCIDKIENKLK